MPKRTKQQESALSQEPEVIVIDADTDEVSCDGGGGALGHPVVWYSLDGKDSAECGYCDRVFVKAGSSRH